MANEQSSAERNTAARHASLKLAALADQTRAEPEFRARLKDAPREALRDYGLELSPELEVRVVENTGEVAHVVMPPNPNTVLADHALVGVAGGVGTAAGGTMATFPSCRGSDMTTNAENHPDAFAHCANPGNMNVAGS